MRLFAAACIAGIASLLPSRTALAVTDTWNGGGADNNWMTPLNWGGTAPVGDGTDDLIFAGTTQLANSNNFTANTQFNSLTFNSGAGAFTLSGNAINLNGNITNNSASLETISLNIALLATETINAASGNVAIGGIISGSGFGLTKTGANTLTLSKSNTYTGTTTINAGTLQVGNGTTGSLNGTTGTALTFSGTGTFNVDEAAASNQGMGSLTLSAGEATIQSTFVGTNATVTFTNLAARTAGATANFITSGGTNGTTNTIVLTNFAGATTPTGALLDRGMFFGGSAYAAYDTGGFLRVYGSSDANYLASPTAATIGASTATSNVDLTTGNITAQTTVSANTINMRNFNIAMTGTSPVLSVNGLLSSGSASATLGGGTTPLLQPAVAGGEIVIRVNGGTDVLTISSIIQNNTSASSLTKSGAGKLTLSGASTFTGNIVINGGTLSDTYSPGSVSPTGSGLGNPQTAGRTVTINNGGTLQFGASNALGNDNTNGAPKLALAINAGGQVTSLATLAGNNILGPVTLNGGTLTTGSGSSGTFQSYAFSGSIAVGGSSPSTIAAGGSTNNGINLGYTSNIAGYQTTFNVGLTGAGGASSNPDLAVSAFLANSSRNGNATGMIKTGSGTMLLSAVNIYTGPTTISAGTLMITGSLGNTAVTVQANAVLSGGIGAANAGTLVNTPGSPDASGATSAYYAHSSTAGGISGSLSILGNGHLAPTSSTGLVGTFSPANLALSANSILDVQFNGSANSLIDVTGIGGLTANSIVGANLYQEGTTTLFDAPGTYHVLEYFGSLSFIPNSTLTVLNPDGTSSYQFGTSNDVSGNHFVDLTISAPEPTSLGLLALASVGLLARRPRNDA